MPRMLLNPNFRGPLRFESRSSHLKTFYLSKFSEGEIAEIRSLHKALCIRLL